MSKLPRQRGKLNSLAPIFKRVTPMYKGLLDTIDIVQEPATGRLAPILCCCISISHTDMFGNLLHRLGQISNANKLCFSLSCSNHQKWNVCGKAWQWKAALSSQTKLDFCLHSLYRGCLVSWQWITNTVKPVCNDHLYDEIYYLWFIQ